MKQDRNILDNFLLEFKDIIEKYTEYIVVSGFVIISSGRSRSTEDIDMIIKRLEKRNFLRMHNELSKKGFECIQSSDPIGIFEYLPNDNSVDI